MEFMIQPIEQPGELDFLKNKICPENAYQCGCNVISGCSCPNTIMEP